MDLQTAVSTWLTILTVSHVPTSQTDGSGEQVSYKGAQVWRVSLKSVKHVVLLKSLEQNKEISLWRVRPEHADFLVLEEYKVQVNWRLLKQDMNHSVLLMDVQRRIDAIATPQAEWNEESLRQGRLNFGVYPTMQVIDGFFFYIRIRNISTCSVQTIGRTSQGRNIQMAVVSNGNPDNKAIMLTGGMHGREWISIASLLYILHVLFNNFNKQPKHVKNTDWVFLSYAFECTTLSTQVCRRAENSHMALGMYPRNLWNKLIEDLQYCSWLVSFCNRLQVSDVGVDYLGLRSGVSDACRYSHLLPSAVGYGRYIVPVVNPDGFVYTHTTDRMWRKNRRFRKWSTCVGVDINRNFGKNWYVNGVTETTACSGGYSGHSAFSEPESIAIKNVAAKRKMAAFVDIHSYGQSILYPYSSLATPVKNEKDLKKLAANMSGEIFKAKKKIYRSGSVYHMLYPYSGSALDYMYDSGVANSFMIETRDEGNNAFLLPPNQILDTSIELQKGLYGLVGSI